MTTPDHVALTVEDVQLLHTLQDAIEDAMIRDTTIVTVTVNADSLCKLIRKPLEQLRLAAQQGDTVKFLADEAEGQG